MSLNYAEHQEKISRVFGPPDFLPLGKKQRLLELGCGVGALSRQVAARAALGPDDQQSLSLNQSHFIDFETHQT